MGANSKIEWTDHTFNPWRGCSKVHTGCLNCYAEKNYSVKMHGVKWGPNGTRVRLSDVGWKEPRKWNKAAECIHSFDCANGDHSDACPQKHRPRVFCASLADVFEDWQGPILNHNGERLYRGAGAYSAKKFRMTGERRFPVSMNDLRRDLFRLVDATPNLDWLLLTKRPENVERMWCSHVNTDGMPPSQLYRHNVWLGCSVSDQATADAMIPELLKCRDLTPVLFVSAEPLLDAIDFSNYLGGINEIVPDNIANSERREAISWLILGGESGPHARPCNLSWVRSIRDQCKAAGVPCFVKQLGSRPIEGGDFAAKTGPVCSVQLHDKKGGDWDEWPEDLRVRELPEVQP